MSPNGQLPSPGQGGATVIVANFPMPPGARFDWHAHDSHQVAWAADGVLTAITEATTFILPPTRALWLPAGMRHEIQSSGNAVMRALYVRPEGCRIGWATATAVGVTPLLAELIQYLAELGSGGRRSRAEALLFDLLVPVPMTTIEVRVPAMGPASTVAEALIADPAQDRTLAEWGRAVGASERSLARCFLSEAGLSFGRWRTLVRLRAALPKLATGAPIAGVARHVGYETTSAFVAAFRRETGVTPGSYFRGSSAEGR